MLVFHGIWGDVVQDSIIVWFLRIVAQKLLLQDLKDEKKDVGPSSSNHRWERRRKLQKYGKNNQNYFTFSNNCISLKRMYICLEVPQVLLPIIQQAGEITRSMGATMAQILKTATRVTEMI